MQKQLYTDVFSFAEFSKMLSDKKVSDKSLSKNFKYLLNTFFSLDNNLLFRRLPNYLKPIQ